LAGYIVRTKRRNRGLRQNELAAKAGYHPRTIYRIETGKENAVSANTARDVLQALNGIEIEK